ncbi:MAG TPA: exodeoxyribonuclease VII large subunit [Saprospiraceae bacterium]|nr:exodeoxyribonuclease VII large subunit [Saprospiraceae bacterium]HMQ84438.1 exodeoxyribonuclease VII large subunit [Saprospiraceae bacterium]
MNTHSLFELNEYIKRVLALNLKEPLWISCEIAQIKASRVHYFLNLIEKEPQSDNIIAHADAVIWEKQYALLRKSVGSVLPELLRAGLSVRLQVSVDFHERYGLQLQVLDIDPAYTLGQLEIRRRQILVQLQNEGLIGLNARLPLPVVCQRIAVISSETAAGYQDFLQHLADNPHGYAFEQQLFSAAMQGEWVSKDIIHRLKEIQKKEAQFDLIVIIRGGGAKLDLGAFDEYELCKAVAQMAIPVLTGIGHDVDEVLLDKVAHTALKTPTAVADFIIYQNARFEERLLQFAQQVQWMAMTQLQTQRQLLEKLQLLFLQMNRLKLLDEKKKLDNWIAQMPIFTRIILQTAAQKLDEMDRVCQLLSVPATLNRGFALVYKNEQKISRANMLEAGDTIQIQFSDAAIAAKADKKINTSKT